MDKVRTVVYPTPSEEEIRGMGDVKRSLKNSTIKKIEETHKLPLTLMWEQKQIPAELKQFMNTNDGKSGVALYGVLLDIGIAKHGYTIKILTKDNPWLNVDQLYFRNTYSSSDIRIYKDYLFTQGILHHRGARPHNINGSVGIYLYNLRYVDPSDYDKLYELVGYERFEEYETYVDTILEEIYNIVSSDDLDSKKKLEDYKNEVSTDFDDVIEPYLEGLMIIVAERMIQANPDSDLTDRLVYILNQIDQTSKIDVDEEDLYPSFYIYPYLDLLKMILYRVNDPIVAIDIIEDQREKYRGGHEAKGDILQKVEELTSDYIKNRLKIEDTSRRGLLKYASTVLYPDRKILK